MVSFGSGASGALSGAALGSSFGPIGTGIGAAAGGLLGLFGGGKKKRKAGLFDSKQKALYDQYIQGTQGRGPQAGLYNFNAGQANDVFDQNVARPAYRNFQENIVPTITGQFRGNNLQNSSYTGEALSRAGRNVQEGLDAQRASLQFQGQESANTRRAGAINNALGMSTFAYEKGNANPIDQILGAAAPSAGSWFADYLKARGGPAASQSSKGFGSLTGASGFGG